MGLKPGIGRSDETADLSVLTRRVWAVTAEAQKRYSPAIGPASAIRYALGAMKTINASGLLVCLLPLVGCASTAARIRKNPELFASYPSATQEKIRAGKVEIGFTKEMVLMALGKPERKISRSSRDGSDEVWVYGGASGPGLGLSLGAGTGGYSTAYGGGISMDSSGSRVETRRITFNDNAVSAMEAAAP
ncbi:MAG: hypothetical protein CO113_03715 [Elusimicrobia bacterium CG_4_9_14_3_um_filter_62_55]|nr:MAG: hypothetical protein COR54_10215 [Elusimicrobia bacterium CG22_combo_CG10-13_8_21_14_all_63_91]PJA17966.1 MAG: hypothetical protein COX66_02820 [Elusimicrobia bacterium CG_4_10_14_0_2_um_filter_63_34]PJB26393.1 MAG: hypothetical protein CO113_03715 [Elusimicrobia bacterium CG_4_9_14_3_um_filter_62_55]